MLAKPFTQPLGDECSRRLLFRTNCNFSKKKTPSAWVAVWEFGSQLVLRWHLRLRLAQNSCM